MSEPLEVLQRIFGHRAFRGRQAEVVAQVMGGGDAVALVPERLDGGLQGGGHGKSRLLGAKDLKLRLRGATGLRSHLRGAGLRRAGPCAATQPMSITPAGHSGNPRFTTWAFNGPARRTG